MGRKTVYLNLDLSLIIRFCTSLLLEIAILIHIESITKTMTNKVTNKTMNALAHSAYGFIE